MFWFLGIWVGAGLYLNGVPHLFYPSASDIKGYFWLLGSIALFIGFYNPIHVALMAWGKPNLSTLANTVIPVIILCLTLFTITNIPTPFTDSYGIIHWNLSYPLNAFWFAAGVLFTMIPAIFLFRAKSKSRKSNIKKTLFSIAFVLGGLGGWGNIMTRDTTLLAISFTIMFFGFLTLAAMSAIDIFMKEENNETAQKQEFTKV